MLFNKLRRYLNDTKKQYLNSVQEYLCENGFSIIQKLYAGVINEFEVHPEHVIDLLGENYPKAPWLQPDDSINQFVSLIETTGYTFNVNNNGTIAFDTYELCMAIVKKHLKINGKQILDRLDDACRSVGGRISYTHMINILGFKFGTINRVDETNMKFCTILFLKETKLPFKFDDAYIYLP